jgi:hypothetical protein
MISYTYKYIYDIYKKTVPPPCSATLCRDASEKSECNNCLLYCNVNLTLVVYRYTVILQKREDVTIISCIVTLISLL